MVSEVYLTWSLLEELKGLVEFHEKWKGVLTTNETVIEQLIVKAKQAEITDQLQNLDANIELIKQKVKKKKKFKRWRKRQRRKNKFRK